MDPKSLTEQSRWLKSNMLVGDSEWGGGGVEKEEGSTLSPSAGQQVEWLNVNRDPRNSAQLLVHPVPLDS